MFRTRDLLILVVSIILTMLIVVISVILTPEPAHTPSPSPAPQEIILSEPKEKYEVVPYEDKSSLRDERDAFIEKVRRIYVPPTVEKEKPIPQPEEVIIVEPEEPPVITTPPVEVIVPPPVSTEIASSTTYGNTGL